MNIQILSDQVQDTLKNSVISLIQSACEKLAQDSKPRYLKQYQAVEYLNTTVVTFNEWVRNRELPEIRINGTIRYDRYDLDKFMLQYKD